MKLKVLFAVVLVSLAIAVCALVRGQMAGMVALIFIVSPLAIFGKDIDAFVTRQKNAGRAAPVCMFLLITGTMFLLFLASITISTAINSWTWPIFAGFVITTGLTFTMTLYRFLVLPRR